MNLPNFENKKLNSKFDNNFFASKFSLLLYGHTILVIKWTGFIITANSLLSPTLRIDLRR